MLHYFEELLAVEDSFDTSMALLNVTLSRGDPTMDYRGLLVEYLVAMAGGYKDGLCCSS